MKLTEFISFIGDEAAAKVLGQTTRTVRAWRCNARMPRLEDAWPIEVATQGRVSAKEIAREAWERRAARPPRPPRQKRTRKQPANVPA